MNTNTVTNTDTNTRPHFKQIVQQIILNPFHIYDLVRENRDILSKCLCVRRDSVDPRDYKTKI